MFLARAVLSPRGSLIVNGLQKQLLSERRRRQLPFALPWRRGVQLVLSVVPFGVLSLKAEESSRKHRDVISYADDLFNSARMEELLEHLKKYQDSDSADVQWRLARAYFKVCYLSTTERSDAEQLAYKAKEHITKALELDSSSYACHEWAGIIISHISNCQDFKTKIMNVYVVRDHFERAIELNPNNAKCHHLLGQWCFAVSEIPWYLRQVVSAIFATPPSSTYDEALRHFQKAEESIEMYSNDLLQSLTNAVEPGFYSTNWLFLGKAHLKLGEKEKAKEWLQRTVAFNGSSAGDEEDKAKAEAKRLLSGL